MKTIWMNQRTGPWPKLPKILVGYNFEDFLRDEEEDQFLITKKDFFRVDTITLPIELLDSSSEGANLRSYPDHFYTYREEDIKVDKMPISLKLADK